VKPAGTEERIVIIGVLDQKIEHGLRLTSLGGTVVTILLSFLLGERGFWLLVTIVVLWFPVSLLWTFLLNRVIPPPLEAYKPKDDPGLSLR
jgi:hypothetical protein